MPITTPSEKPKHPVDLNAEFAFVTAGGGSQILWFTTDDMNNPFVDHLSVTTFHERLANRTFTPDGGKPTAVSKMWMQWPKRKTYDGVIFAPNRDNPRFFNKWRGFLCKPLTEEPTEKAVAALERVKAHITNNGAHGNQKDAEWIFGWLAHMFQRPEQKPRTALVLRGRKGVGKSVIFECLRRIIGTHFCLVANRRFLAGNFNGHLEDKIMYVLEEAFWSGAKDTEGILKDLVTGKKHMIERKGRETYEVDNLARVVILGNDDWIVPASEDERRYAVFSVADHNRNDEHFFQGIAEEMDPRLLLKFFMDFDLSKVNVNKAPDTEALMGQKEQSLDPFKMWWVGSLKLGYLIGSPGDEWPENVSRATFRDAFDSFAKSQNVRRPPNPVQIGKMFKQIAPSSATDKVKREGDILYRVYELASLEAARAEWEQYIGGKVKWSENS